MKKELLLGLIFVSGLTLPGSASLLTVQSGPSVRTISGLKIENPQFKSDRSENQTAALSEPKADPLLTLQPIKPMEQRLVATTELKINLDNFEMEYVLRVQ